MDWRIQLDIDKSLDPVFIKKFFNFLISRGVKYNAKHQGKYSIFVAGAHEKDVIIKENEVKDLTDKLEEIVNTYLKFDLRTASLNIYLDYIDDVEFPFDVSFHQLNDNKCLVFLVGAIIRFRMRKPFYRS